MWVIASLCRVAGCCKTTQHFSCFPAHWNVSGPGVESFLPGVSGFWLLMFRAAPVHPGEQGAGAACGSASSLPYGNQVLQCLCEACQVFNGKVNGQLTSERWELPKGLHHSTTHKCCMQTFPDFTRTSWLSSPLDLDRQQHLGLVLIPHKRHFFRCC